MACMGISETACGGGGVDGVWFRNELLDLVIRIFFFILNLFIFEFI